MSRVPVSMLTCADMKGHEILRYYGPLSEDEMAHYFEMLRDVFDRWFHAVGYLGPAVYINYLKDRSLLDNIETQFGEVMEEDDPVKAWRVRRDLQSMLDGLDRVVAEMAQVFHAPPSLHEFYYNLASRLRATYDYITDSGACL